MSSWGGETFLIKLGGVTAILSGILFISVLLFFAARGGGVPPLEAEAILRQIVEEGSFLTIPSTLLSSIFVLMIPTALALYVVFRKDVAGYALIALTLSVVGMLLAGIVQYALQTWIFPEVATFYAKATSATERTVAIFVAQTLRRFISITVFFSDLFIAIAVAVYSLAMRQTKLFPNRTFRLGFIIAILGLVGTPSTIILTPESLLTLGVVGIAAVILLVPWVFLTGHRLLRIAHEQA